MRTREGLRRSIDSENPTAHEINTGSSNTKHIQWWREHSQRTIFSSAKIISAGLAPAFHCTQMRSTWSQRSKRMLDASQGVNLTSTSNVMTEIPENVSARLRGKFQRTDDGRREPQLWSRLIQTSCQRLTAKRCLMNIPWRYVWNFVCWVTLAKLFPSVPSIWM